MPLATTGSQPPPSALCFVVQSLSRIQLFATPWTAAPKASLSFLYPWVCSDSCPLSWWYYLTQSPCATLFFCLQSFPASGSFPMSQLFAPCGQSVGISVSALPINIQGWFPLGLTGFVSLLSKGLSEFSLALQFKGINSSAPSLLYGPTLTSIHDYWKKHRSDYMELFQQSALLPRSKHLLISWLLSPSTVILEPKKIKPTTFYFLLIYLPWSDGTRCHDLSFFNIEL